MGFPTKNDHFGGVLGGNTHIRHMDTADVKDIPNPKTPL